jgi:Ca2+-binding RTX toxin-like protein
MATINGTTGNDTLNGTSGDDTISGLDGDDTINGLGGNDTIDGGSGTDTIDGGDGNDIINGGDGRDYIHGGAGDDVIHAGDTSNLLFPEYVWDGDGNDTVYGEGGQDFFYGSAGNDYYDGGTGGTQSFEGDGISYADALAAIRVDMRLATSQVTSRAGGDAAGIGTDTLVNMEGVTGSAFDDVMIAGNIGMALRGGAGNDTLVGGSGWDTLTGDEGNDVIRGGAGNDTLTAGNGDDFLEGGDGDDSLDGGAGIDTASYENATSGVTVSLGALDSGWSSTEGVAQSTGGAGTDTLTSIENLTGSNFNDTLNGTFSGSVLDGRAGDDTLQGGTARDVLIGGDGSDVLRGGSGDDLYVIGAAAEHVFAEISDFEGVDEVRFASVTAGETLTLFAGDSGIERIVIGTGTGTSAITSGTIALNVNASALQNAVTMIGNEARNRLTGTDFGDTLEGLGGNDLLTGGNGDDVIDGGAGFDIADFSGGAAVNVSLAAAGPQDTGQGTDTLISVEGLNGSSFGDVLIGDALENSIGGGDGDDQLFGGFGDDNLYADNGDDHIDGGDGDDYLDGGDGNDYLDGGTGVDYLVGGEGDDTYVVTVASGADHIIDSGGTDTLMSDGTWSLPDGIENFTAIGSGGTEAYGNILDNVMTGGAGDDLLTGSSGDDTLYGGAGNDELRGESGNDRVYGQDGDDLIVGGYLGDNIYDGGAGRDTLSYQGSVAVNIDLGISGPQDTGGYGFDTISGIENLVGSAVGDNLKGNGAANVIEGGSGADVLSGLGGNDTLLGGAGDDIIQAGDGDDRLSDGAGNDTVYGGDGDDIIYGSPGDDYYDGGAGNDTVNYEGAAAAISVSLVRESEQASSYRSGDPANIGSDILLNIETIVGSQFSDLIVGSGGAETLVGGAGDDVVSGRGGADKLLGGLGDDTFFVVNSGVVVTEYAGEGTDTVHSWVSFALPDNVENLQLFANQNSVATGNALDNRIVGSTHDDIIDGREGADVMRGDGGNDVYYVDNSGDLAVENASEGTDTVYSAINYRLRANFENLNITGSAIRAIGNSLDNRLVGDALDNILDGAAGADTMRGGAGDDRYYVDNGGDLAIENAGEGVDSVYSAISFKLGANVENLNLAGAAVRASGNSLDNRLVGTDGDNILNGGAGADVMRGGLGNDLYYVDNSGDKVIEAESAGRDRVYSTVSYTLAANSEDLFLRGSEAINATGNSLDNVLRGNSAANILTGGAGADDLRGGTGADTFVFRDGDFAGLTPSTADRIIDFSHSEGDRIDLRQVDADSGLDGTQHFSFIGSDSFHDVAGELRYEIINGNTYVYGDTNGDGLADLMIRLDGSHALVSGDFIVG